ncbi:MAG: nucleotidyl transferase AbiEii/AbiGii toxin family protein [bacterium]|nr:nucleotidyl transferase AbiEii/AbiGii toxin family protein [bacterium]
MALLAGQPWLKDFYLAGGTGLAMHLGHRQSDDLDFFSTKDVDPKKIRSLLSSLGHLKIEMERGGTLWAILEDTKVSFISYNYPLLESTPLLEGVSIAGLKDIACMKLDCVSSRGSRKDFIDLYFILQSGHSLQSLLIWFKEKYRAVDYNQAHLMKSLNYFEDADREAEPLMIQKWKWDEVKAFFLREIKKLIV